MMNVDGKRWAINIISTRFYHLWWRQVVLEYPMIFQYCDEYHLSDSLKYVMNFELILKIFVMRTYFLASYVLLNWTNAARDLGLEVKPME